MRSYERLYSVPDDLIGHSLDTLKAGVAVNGNAQLKLRKGAQAWLDCEGHNRSNIFLKNAWDPLDTLFCAFDQTGEDRYLTPLLDLVDDWCSTFDTLDIANQLETADQSEDLVWYDMAAGLRVYRLAYLIELLTQRQSHRTLLEKLHRSFTLHHAFLRDDKNFRQNNHGLYQAFGQITAGSRLAPLDIPGAQQMAEQGHARFAKVITTQFNKEGIHLEHSPGYQIATTQILKNLIKNDLITDPHVLKLVTRLTSNTKWFFAPDGQPVNFGDTDHSENVQTTPKPIKAGQVQSVTFPGGGYFVVRARPAAQLGKGHRKVKTPISYIALMAAFHSRTHKHCDDCTFIWYHNGHSVLVDGGRFGYGGKQVQKSALWHDGYWYSAPQRVHLERSRAHNTIEINARNMPRRNIDPYGSGIIGSGKETVQLGEGVARTAGTGDEIYFVDSTNAALKAHVEHLPDGTTTKNPVYHRRLLIVLPASWVICIDTIRAEIPVMTRQWFNFAERFECTRLSPAKAVMVDHDTNEQFTAISLTDDAGPLEMGHGWQGAEDEGIYPDLLGWHSREANSFYKNVALAMGAAAPASARTIATLLVPGTARADHAYTRLNATARRGRFRFTYQDHIYTLTYARDQIDTPSQVKLEVTRQT